MILNSGSAGGGGSIKIKTGTIPVSDYYVSTTNKKTATYNIGFKPFLMILYDGSYFTSNDYYMAWRYSYTFNIYTANVPHIICENNISSSAFINFTSTGFTVNGTIINPYGSTGTPSEFNTLYYVALG